MVERGGDVIPKVVKVLEDKDIRAARSSFTCRSAARCAAATSCATEGEADHRCVNANCPAKLRESILHFASRGVMNIEGMGDALVESVDRHAGW